MGVDIRLPQIDAENADGQIAQIRSYLLQLAQQLNWALGTMGSSSADSSVPAVASESTTSGGEVTIGLVKSLLVQSDDLIYEKINANSDNIKSLEKSISSLNETVRKLDFQVESDTVNGWTYKKWNSGDYEMFGVFTLTTTKSSTESGSLFLSDEFIISSPFEIESAIVLGSASDSSAIVNAGQIADNPNNIGFRLLSPIAFESNTEITVNLSVVGKVK